MTEPNRPSLRRVHTRKSEAKRQETNDAGIRITVGDDPENLDVFEIRIGDVTPELTREFRKVTGYSFRHLMDTIGDDPDIDVLTDFEWFARRLRGEDVTLDQCGFTYADIDTEHFDVSETGPSADVEGQVDDPES